MKLIISALITCLSLGGCSNPNKDDNNVDVNGCLESIGCSISRFADRVQLKLPSDIVPERLFNLSLKFEHPVARVTAYLEGVSMFMGKIPVIFNYDEQQQGYNATTILGRCNDERMKWRLILHWQENGRPMVTHKVFTISEST